MNSLPPPHEKLMNFDEFYHDFILVLLRGIASFPRSLGVFDCDGSEV
jgi:hypothetical protein